MRILTLISVLSPVHGGLTRASFRRSKALMSAGQSVTTISFNIEPDFEGLVAHVRDTSELADLPIVNCYNELMNDPRVLTSRSCKRFGVESTARSLDSTSGLRVQEGDFLSNTQTVRERTYVDGSDLVIRVDYVDHNGNVRLVDEREIDGMRARRLSVFDRDGTLVASGGNWALQNAWLDSVIGSEETLLILDGHHLWSSLAKYTRSNVYKLIVNHGSHIAYGENPSTGRLRTPRIVPFRHSGTLDGMICLTATQARHLRARVNPSCPIEVVPNVNPPVEFSNEDRDDSRCVVVTRLEEESKRFADMLAVMGRASASLPSLRFDVYGGPTDGDQWDRYQQLVSEYSLSDVLTFHGSTHNGASKFAEGSFTLLTSRNEGQALTLVEAMSRGCLPISYDIDYGPADTITDGINGWLVSAGDVDAMADRIIDVVKTSDLDSMRKAAVASASKYSPDVVAGEFLRIFNDLKLRRSSRNRLRSLNPIVRSIDFRDDVAILRVETEWDNLSLAASCGVGLFAVNQKTLKWNLIAARCGENSGDKIESVFVLARDDFDGISSDNMVFYIRYTMDGASVDSQLRWPNISSLLPVGNV